MDVRTRTLQPALATSAAMDHLEETQAAEADEPPERLEWSPTKLHFSHLKQTVSQRRESLLTQQILSETEHTDDDHPPPPRTMSTQSTWSNPSTTSMAELTSDDGRSVASPAISPPLPPTQRNNSAIPEKPLETNVKIVGEDHVSPAADPQPTSEKTVEANLGRKRCISFACRSKQETKVEQPPPPQPEPASPPKRKCMLKFVCPSKSGSDSKPATKTPAKRPVSPPPPQRRPSVGKHRGSDATVVQTSPKATRKNSIQVNPTPTSDPVESPASPVSTRRYSEESSDEDRGDSLRFHEFASSDDEPDQWVQESTCHRTRLTVNDTLQKENVIRKTCEEVEEEALEEEEDMEEEDLDDELAAVADMDDEDDDLEAEDDYESDEGFHSDDEDGFANSDSEEDDDSDYEWWNLGGGSTAATSVEQLDRLAIVNSQKVVPSSSIASASSGEQMSRLASRTSFKKAKGRPNQTEAVPIHRSGSPDLPDSTDFVCGTLDEDRPMEQAYINKRKMKDAAKHKLTPQDIDPTFPTSDPEMDEEDDDDVDEVIGSETDDMMHGDLDELHGTIKKALPMRPRGRSNAHRSPPPPTTRIHSPGPAKRTGPRSPPPTKRARSPAPRKLFGHSPRRSKSPAPLKRMTSPPNSPTNATAQLSTAPFGLAGRPQLTHTASLPRGGPITLSKLGVLESDEDSDTGAATEIPKRGAIDIVKGVQWKRQRRKEKLHQKMCAKAAAAKGEKQHKVKPGKGAERMREVGLQLQEYRGKAEHILSL